MISRVPIPCLSVLPVESGAGKTLVAGAIADWFRRRDLRAAVSVPIATGASRRREGLVSEEAEFLAGCADAPHPLDLICPVRFEEDLVPLVAARRRGEPLDWPAVQRSIEIMSRGSDVMIAQAPATLLTPVDEKLTTLDLLKALGGPVVLVSRAGLAQINSCALTVRALREAGLSIAGIVINRYPAEGPSIDQEQSLREIEKWTKTPVLCVVPDEPFTDAQLGEGITGAIDLVDWQPLAGQRDEPPGLRGRGPAPTRGRRGRSERSA